MALVAFGCHLVPMRQSKNCTITPRLANNLQA
jgi:hypothetical protein